jgi:hypothetical protein
MWCLEILLLAILGKGRGASVQNRNVWKTIVNVFSEDKVVEQSVIAAIVKM